MLQFLFSSDNSLAGLILRLTIGCIMLPHGAQKTFGWFGGYGFKTTMNYFTETLRLPWLISVCIILIELAGAICLILGFGSKIWAVLFIIIMLGAIVITNYANGFFMNWFGNQKGEGFEYHLLVIGLCAALILTGGGKFAIDQFLMADA
jgi:putative oxidoreductase